MAHKINLNEYERIVCAYAQKSNGPGWSSKPLWVVIEDKRNGRMREECVQSGMQSDDMLAVYDIAAEVNETLTEIVKRMVIVNARKDG